MDKSTVIDKVKQYANLVCNYFPVQQVILFGSYAKGNANEYSDIDVSIEPVLFETNSEDPSGFLEEIHRTGEIIYNN